MEVDMPEDASHNNGKYLYAIVEGPSNQTYGPIGVEDQLVYTASTGRMAAVVSDYSKARIRPERRHLACHQGVLKELMAESTPLPMAFGIIADDAAAIERIISLNQDAFLEQFDHVKGKAEMGLRVTWDVQNIFDYFVDLHPELRAARDRYFGSNREPSQSDKMELGRLFDNLIKQDREDHTEAVEGILSEYCFEIKQNPCRNEKEVMNLACLVGRDESARFEEGIMEAAKLFDNNFAFDYNGPWAPHNFVQVDLEL